VWERGDGVEGEAGASAERCGDQREGKGEEEFVLGRG